MPVLKSGLTGNSCPAFKLQRILTTDFASSRIHPRCRLEGHDTDVDVPIPGSVESVNKELRLCCLARGVPYKIHAFPADGND